MDHGCTIEIFGLGSDANATSDVCCPSAYQSPTVVVSADSRTRISSTSSGEVSCALRNPSRQSCIPESLRWFPRPSASPWRRRITSRRPAGSAQHGRWSSAGTAQEGVSRCGATPPTTRTSLWETRQNSSSVLKLHRQRISRNTDGQAHGSDQRGSPLTCVRSPESSRRLRGIGAGQ